MTDDELKSKSPIDSVNDFPGGPVEINKGKGVEAPAEVNDAGEAIADEEPEIEESLGGEAGAQQPTRGSGGGLGAKIDEAKQMASDYAKKYLSKAAFKAAGSAVWAFVVANIWWILLVLLGILIAIGIWSYFTSMRESGASGTTDPRFANSLADDEVITQLLLGANDNQTKTKLSSEVIKDFQNAIANIANDPDISAEDKKIADDILLLLEKINSGEDVQKNIGLLREEIEKLINNNRLVSLCSIGYSPQDKSASGYIQLPKTEDGFDFFEPYGSYDNKWARPRVVNAVLAVAIRFYLETGKKLVIADLSQENSGVFSSHNRHDDGTHADIYVKTFSGETPSDLTAEEQTKLGQMLVGCGATTIQYNSAEVISAVNSWASEKNIIRKDGVKIVRPYDGHDDHFHVHLPLPF